MPASLPARSLLKANRQPGDFPRSPLPDLLVGISAAPCLWQAQTSVGNGKWLKGLEDI